MPPTPITSNTLDLSAVSGVDDPLIARLRKQGRATTLDLSTGYASYVPQRPGAYLRLSKEDINEERRERKEEANRRTAIQRQREDVEAKRESLGWGTFAKLYEDPDTSAHQKRKVTRPDGSVDRVVLRPQFQQMLKDLLAGTIIDGVVFYDLDRVLGQPRDLQGLANVVNETRRPAIGATSEPNLVRGADCNIARVICVMLLNQSQDTSRRVARETLAAAEMGIPIGRLGYGWVRKGSDAGRIIEAAAKVIRRVFRGFLEGAALTAIVRELISTVSPPPPERTGTPHGKSDHHQSPVRGHGPVPRNPPTGIAKTARRVFQSSSPTTSGTHLWAHGTRSSPRTTGSRHRTS